MDYTIAFILMSIGIYVLYLSIKSITLECKKIIEYRYVPRTFEEEQLEPVKPSIIFSSMFERGNVRNGGGGTEYISPKPI